MQTRIEGQRAAVFAAWRQHGPCTTKELAERSGLSILSLRPRTTELLELGYVRLADEQPVKGEGTYRAANSGEVFEFFQQHQREARNLQRELAFG